MNKHICATILGLLALPLAAQDTGFGVNGNVILGLDSLRKATNNSLGVIVGVDYKGHIPGSEMAGRVGLSIASMPGTAKNELKTSLSLVQVYGDLLIGEPAAKLKGIAGISLNNYSMQKSGVESEDEHDVDHHFPVRDVKGLKLGVRLGVTYAFTPHLSGELLLQQTELAGKDLGDPMVRAGGINPAWIQVGLRYGF